MFNIYPGGQGSGGQGGSGAPLQNISEKQAKEALEKSPKQTATDIKVKSKIKNNNKKQLVKNTSRIQLEKKILKNSPAESKSNTQIASIPSREGTIKTSNRVENSIMAPGKTGPGSGDGKGEFTGPGGGKGQGMGNGEGTGVGSGKGPGGVGKIGSGDPSGQGGDGKKILQDILRKLEREHHYPKEAQREKLEGKTQFAFKIQTDGSIKYARIVKSSGHPILDQAALQAVKKAAPFPYYPKEIRYGYRYDIK